MAAKYYAVRKGRVPGIYRSWEECKKQVEAYSSAEYKSFVSQNEAMAFMTQTNCVVNNTNQSLEPNDVKAAFAYVDGSFNASTGVYGYGGFIEYQGKRENISGSGRDADMASMRNVAGEILGCTMAISKAIELGLKEIAIYYDYMGIEMWATGAWKRNKKGTVEYYNFIQSNKEKINISFVKVKGHSGVEGNELADRLAKKAAGII